MDRFLSGQGSEKSPKAAAAVKKLGKKASATELQGLEQSDKASKFYADSRGASVSAACKQAEGHCKLFA